MNLDFLPAWPMHLSYPLLFGVLLVVGMMGGEIARLMRMPRVIGYVVVGFVLGPLVLAMGIDLIDEARIFVDLALGLVLFDLGRRMDLKWMRRDWTLAVSGLAESLLSFGAAFAVLLAFKFPAVEAGLAAAIAMSTSPAVLMLIVRDTSSEGQVTGRALNLVALNGLLASIIVTIMVGSAHFQVRMDLETALLHPLYLFLGSIALGGSMAALSRVIARSIEKSRDVHFTLIAGLVVAAVGLATLLKLPVFLALLSIGLFARNDQRGYDLLNVNLAPAGQAALHRALRDHRRQPAAHIARHRRVDRARIRGGTRSRQDRGRARDRPRRRASHETGGGPGIRAAADVEPAAAHVPRRGHVLPRVRPGPGRRPPGRHHHHGDRGTAGGAMGLEARGRDRARSGPHRHLPRPPCDRRQPPCPLISRAPTRSPSASSWS